MIRLAYFSSIAPRRPASDREAILATSRRNNPRLGITSMLIHHKGDYLQILEGPSEPVLHLFVAIEADPRHTGVTEIFREATDHWSFPGVPIGFHDLDGPGARIEGYERFLREHFDLGALQPAGALALFNLFKPGHARDAARSAGLPTGAH